MYARTKGQSGTRIGKLNWLAPLISAQLRLATAAAIAVACLFAGSALHAQDAGYMRMMTSSGRQVAGASTDPAHNGWIPLRQVTMPSASEIEALATEPNDASANSTDKAVHKPVVLIKDRDQSSLVLLGGMTSHQHFPEVDIVVTRSDAPIARYKLTDVTIISLRGGGTNGDTDTPREQLRLNYAKIEIEH
jgi:type VI secretion system Hcp family effector